MPWVDLPARSAAAEAQRARSQTKLLRDAVVAAFPLRLPLESTWSPASLAPTTWTGQLIDPGKGEE